MCSFGAWVEWSSGRRSIFYYINAYTINNKYYLLNPIPLEIILGHMMEDAVGANNFNEFTQKIINLIDGYISTY